jgi:hypothetical protein
MANRRKTKLNKLLTTDRHVHQPDAELFSLESLRARKFDLNARQVKK